jgi:nucleotide-binding universal stress UspA family protein
MFTVLCPTDFSEIADVAVNYSVELCKKLNAKLHVFHLIYPSFANVDGSGTYAYVSLDINEQMDLSNGQLEKLKGKYQSMGFELTTSTEYGFWGETLEKLEDTFSPNLFVTGTNGASSVLSAKLLGQNSLEFVQSLKCPVLVVPHDYSFSVLDKIVYATDYQFDDIDFAKFVLKLAKSQNAKIEYIHVSKDETSKYQDEYMLWLEELVNKEISYRNLQFKILKGSRVEETLEKYALEENIDMLCVSTREKGILASLFGHSHVTKLVVDAKVPILVFHLHENFKM